MRSFVGLFVVVCVAALSVWAAANDAENLAPGVLDFSRSEANLTVSRSFPGLTSITLLNPTVVSEDKLVDIRQYKVFGIPGEPFRPEEGYPTVPQVTRFYRIPDLGSVDLVIQDAQYDVLDNVDVAPYQEEGATEITPTAAVDGWFPPNVAELSAPMMMRDFRVVLVTLNPVQVNPSKRQVRIYRSLSVDVVPNDRPGINEFTHPRRPSQEYVPIYRSLISNLEDADLINATTRPGTYLIIVGTDPTYRPYADSLYEWKMRKGFNAVISANASWSPTTIISAVQAMYSSSANTETPLEYVCLVGDPAASGVPSNGTRFDHDYGRGNNNDEIEDIAVGRLSGSGVTEMQTINSKIMNYERTPWMADTAWFHRAYLDGDIGAHPSPAISNYRSMQWTAWQFRRYTCVNTSVIDYTDSQFPAANLVTQLTNGISFFVWRGSYIGQLPYDLPTFFNSMPTSRELPICLGITCDSNDFTNGAGFMEQFLTCGTPSQPKGGVAAIGTSTSGTHQPPNICLTGGFIYNATNLGVEHLGPCLTAAKFWLFRTFLQQSSFPALFSEYCNLMGDPGLSMWTCVPTILNVTHPTTLNVGARQISVTVMDSLRAIPVADAIVTAWKRGTDSTYALGRTNASGQVILPLNINAPGDLLLTVTKRNVKPYLYTIACAQAAVMPMLSSYTVSDSGMTNGQMNPGETISLPTYIRNFGNVTTATSVSATLTSDNPRVTVLTGSATYGNLAPGDSALGSVPFRIHSTADLQNNAQTLLTVTINSSAGQTMGVIPLTCQAGEAAYLRQHISTASFEPGSTTNLQVVLKNQGSIQMNTVTGHLRSYSAFVTVTDSTAAFGNIVVGVPDSNVADVFTLSASALAFRGHQAPMMLILNTSDGFADTVQFTVNVGTAGTSDPAGPDAYGYYAYDNTDVIYDMHPTFSYVDISQSGNRLALNDPGEAGTLTPVYSVARRLPFTFKFYGQRYDTITICSNGWVAFGDQSYNDLFRNYPMPAQQAPDAMIAPYWDDLQTSNTGTQGVYVSSDAANHRYIIQWKAGGGYSTFSTPLDFEVILLDSTYYPTHDGNGQVLVQYQTISTMLQGDSNDEPGCTVGIQDATCTVGLNYLYESAYGPGAAAVQNGRAILFTTETTSNTPQPLTLTAPNAGVIWFRNTVDSIAWYGGNLNDHIRIDLSRTGSAGSWETLAASVANTRTFGYTVTGPVSANCYVRISSLEHPTDADTSTGAFSISGIRLASPNGGEIWFADSTETVSWEGGSPSSAVQIELSRWGSGGPWDMIAGSAPNTGSYSFTLTGSVSSQCRVRVTSLYDLSDTDVSDADFSISQIQTIYSENFDGGAAGWTHASGGGAWRDNWILSTERSLSGTTSYKCGSPSTGNYADSCDARLTSPNLANLPAHATLTFVQQIESEISGQYPDSAYDGGVLEIASDGGAFAALTPVGDYPKHFRTTAGSGSPFTGPMPGQPCWAGSITTWSEVQVDLEAYAGHAIQLRWRFGSDKATNREGWYVDDVRIVAPVSAPPAPVVPTGLTLSLDGTALMLRWNADGNVAYRIYGAMTAQGPFETLIGTTTTSSFAVPDSTNSNEKFFQVVGWNGQ